MSEFTSTSFIANEVKTVPNAAEVRAFFKSICFKIEAGPIDALIDGHGRIILHRSGRAVETVAGFTDDDEGRGPSIWLETKFDVGPAASWKTFLEFRRAYPASAGASS